MLSVFHALSKTYSILFTHHSFIHLQEVFILVRVLVDPKPFPKAGIHLFTRSFAGLENQVHLLV